MGRQLNFATITAFKQKTVKKSLFVAGTAVLSCLLPLEAKAVSFSGLYVFGDSLSDTGTVYETSLESGLGVGFPPSPPYAQQLSNGPVWVEYLGDKLGLTPTLFKDVEAGVSAPEGINFAAGGATSGTANTLALTSSVTNMFPSLNTLPGLQQQIASFKGQIPVGESADADALYVIWVGATDYLPTEGTFQPFNNPVTPVQNIGQAIADLGGLGAKNILVANLPSLGSVPLVLGLDQQFPGISAGLNTLTQAHNQLLDATVLQPFSANLNIIPLDVQALFAQAIAPNNPLGFTNATDACLNQMECVLNPAVQNQFVFWDPIHPTTAAHQQIGEFAYATLKARQPASVPEPASVLGLLTFGAVGAGAFSQRRRQARQAKGTQTRS